MKSGEMHVQYDAIGGAGLQFFGKVSASIAHELKNVLAIINENAGLLEDLSYAAQRGSAIDPERLNRACLQFTKQIQRADGIMKNMSRFAHSVDVFDAQVALHELVCLVANLAGRLAAMRKLTIEVTPAAIPIAFSGNPFLLQNLIWLCLEFAFGATSAGSTLLLALAKNETGITLRISGIDSLENNFPSRMPAGYEDLLAALGAKLSVDKDTKELILDLP
ncbi:MAG: sensor histidine kinase [Proteobacteria bacterium]|nr:sensor histidine kinase [Pseudomonadota bacterium]